MKRLLWILRVAPAALAVSVLAAVVAVVGFCALVLRLNFEALHQLCLAILDRLIAWRKRVSS